MKHFFLWSIYICDDIYLQSIDLEFYRAFRWNKPEMTACELVAQSGFREPKWLFVYLFFVYWMVCSFILYIIFIGIVYI